MVYLSGGGLPVCSGKRPLNGCSSTLTLLVEQQDGSLAHKRIYSKLECGPMPNVMVALPNTGGALCSTPQSLADAHY